METVTWDVVQKSLNNNRSIGTKISNNVLNVNKQPEDFINYGRIPPDMALGNTTPEHVLKIIQKSKNKFSKDIFGISSKMIKFI